MRTKEITKVSRERFDKIVLGMCYSKYVCKQLEINYYDIREDDFRRIRDYVKETYRVEVEDESM